MCVYVHDCDNANSCAKIPALLKNTRIIYHIYDVYMIVLKLLCMHVSNSAQSE